ncbi:hypothetical protein L2E82_49772 [Cichorium intybus]|uniref:Uncharacterized protein n=1 Tax=Cichorium intybus TaxID=13427 RepID=A0ACB8Z226_CICIN|nr:hypothetical protein L2E82_49772 [Cichorium intybus]
MIDRVCFGVHKSRLARRPALTPGAVRPGVRRGAPRRGAPRRSAPCSQAGVSGGVRPGVVRLGAVRDKILRISFQGKEQQTLVVANLQISRESVIDKNGAVSERDPAKGKDKVRD